MCNLISSAVLISFPIQMYRNSYCAAPSVGVGDGVSSGVSVSKMLKFYVKTFYVMGKGLSEEYPVHGQDFLALK